MSEEIKQSLDRIIALAEGFMSRENHAMFKDSARALAERDEPTREVIERIRHTESVDRALNAFATAIKRWGREDNTPRPCFEAEAELIRQIYKMVVVLEAGKRPESSSQIALLLGEANSLLRSAFAIASRDGAETNWTSFRNAVRLCLIKQSQLLKNTSDVHAATCTPLVYRI